MSGHRHRRRLSPRFFAAETTIIELTLVAALVAAPLMLGSVYRWSLAVLLVLSAVLALGLLATPALKDRVVPGFGIILCACAAYVALQALPLPRAVVQLLSPNAAETYRDSLAPAGQLRFHPLSLDGPATGVELAKALIYAVAFAASFALAGRGKARRQICMALAGTGLLLALIGYGHRLANLDRLFGFYRFRDVSPAFLSTFANKNNLAGLLCLCAPMSLALALTANERKRAALWGICYVLMGAAIFLTLSRGGMIAFVLGQLLLAVLLPRSVASLGIRAALSAMALLVAGYLALGELAGRLVTLAPGTVSKEYKFRGMVEAAAMLRAYPLTGIGRGAFPTAGARYLDVPLGTAQYIENETLQALVDLGVPMGMLLLLGGLLLWFGAVRPRLHRGSSAVDGERSPLTAGLAAGLASLFAQNQVDFSLELAGVALPAVVAMGLLAAEGRASPPASKGWPLHAKAIGAFALVLLPVAALGLWHGRHDWRSEVDAFATRATAAPDFSALREEAAPLLRHHPASFVVPLALAMRGLREKPPEQGAALALHFVNRALILKPSNPDGHLVAAEALALLGKKAQSLLETRLYFEASGGDDRGLRRLIARTADLDDLLQAVPPSAEGLRALNALLVERRRWSDALVVADAWLLLAPDSADAHRERGRDLKAIVRTEDAERELRRAVELRPEEPVAVVELAALLQGARRPGEAREVLARGLLSNPGEPRLSFELANLELFAGRPEAAAGALRQARVVGPMDRAKVLEITGDVEAALGHGNRAFTEYDQAAVLAPGSSAPWKAVAQLERLSRFEEAQVYLKRLRANAGPEQAIQLDSRIGGDAQKATEQRLSGEGAARKAAQEAGEIGGKGDAP